MEDKNSKKKFFIIEAIIIVLTIAILCTILFAIIKSKNKLPDYNTQRLQSLNTVVADKNDKGDFEINQALEKVYSNGQDVISRDLNYAYVWNKKNQKFEYMERSKIPTLNNDYQEMEIIENATDVKNACENGGIFYLDKDLLLTANGEKSFSVKNDLIIVGGKNNIILSTCLDAIFNVDKDGVNLTVYGMKLKGKSSDDKVGTKAAINVNANNANINVYGCDISDIAYPINVRNYGNLDYKFTNGNPVTAGCSEDAVCSVTIKNSKLNGKGCINWKYVGGNCLIENSSLYSNADWTLICLEGNGVNVDIKNCSLVNANEVAVSGIIQCHAKNCKLNFYNCQVNSLITNDEKMLAVLSADGSFGSEQDALDYSVYSGKAGGVYIDLSNDNWGVQEGNKITVNNQTVCEN